MESIIKGVTSIIEPFFAESEGGILVVGFAFTYQQAGQTCVRARTLTSEPARNGDDRRLQDRTNKVIADAIAELTRQRYNP